MFLFDRKPSVYKRHRALFIWSIIIIFLVLIVLIFVFAILPFILVAGYTGFTIAETPEFCGYVCHNMKPYYESYENSTHRGIKCGECHNEPGFIGFFRGTVLGAINETVLYISGNYNKEPIVCDMSGKSCIREECHKVELLNEKELMFKDIPFSHSIHTGEMLNNIKVKCTSCHANDSIVHMKIDIATCYLCHTDGILKDDTNNCLTCHKAEDIEKIKQFDHKEIIKDNISCIKCHKSSHEIEEVRQERCDLCHYQEQIKKEEYKAKNLHLIHTIYHTVNCLMCHSSISHDFKEVELSENCYDCHNEIKTLRSTRFRNRYFPHLLHTSKYVAQCKTCHSSKKQNHGKLIISSPGCRRCHHTQKSIKCAKCHSIQNSVQNGLSISDIKGVEGYKSNVIDCKACHKKLTEPSSLTRIKEQCTRCHEEEYKNFVTEWQSSTVESIQKIENRISTINPDVNLEAKKLIKEAKELLSYVRVDGSMGVHNLDYIEEILNKAASKVNKAAKLVKGS